MLVTKVSFNRLIATRTGWARSVTQLRWASQQSSGSSPEQQGLTGALMTKETTTTTSPSGAVKEKSETIEATVSANTKPSETAAFKGIISAIDSDGSESLTAGIFKDLGSGSFSRNNNRKAFPGANMSEGSSTPLFLGMDLSEFDSTPYHIHVNVSPNNTIITLTRPNGSPLITTSGGSAGFKKAARSGYEAAHQAALQLLEKINTKNIRVNNVNIILKGFGPGRDAAYKALATANWNIKRITDATPVPFGGCRPKKQRRL
ncbi:hypothetical protein BDF20DRAFT_848362 [Mycotypha africana]|uniref:uncharacterized protein n=1 Tax=Mycotypha africana TaxID=64632 RepID=UPI0023016DD2|nr:uncharacterized protein BDF20DRAFT_848362 [Mycotypha africana]KAI8992114.1 hypothetical protein BDF20DRAFT_848362 [Mycotypha africana]